MCQLLYLALLITGQSLPGWTMPKWTQNVSFYSIQILKQGLANTKDEVGEKRIASNVYLTINIPCTSENLLKSIF